MSEQDQIKKHTGSKPPEEGYGIFDLILISIADIPRIMRTLKFAVWVIFILAFFTLAGSILPQEKFATDPQSFAEQYTNLFNLDPDDGRFGFGEMLYHGLVKPFQLHRIFDSSHYFVLLLVLAISSALCAWDRLLITRKLARLTKAKSGRESIIALQHSAEGKAPVALADAEKRARDYLGSRGFKIFTESKENETVWIFGRSNFFRHYAAVIFHLAFVFILVGGIIGHERSLGYEGNIPLSEGEISLLGEDLHGRELGSQSGDPFTPSRDERIQLIDYQNIYRERDFGGVDPETGLPNEYYGVPSDYISHLRVIKLDADGEITETITEKAIEVNYPLKFGAVRYFQLGVDAGLFFNVHYPGGETEEAFGWLNRDFEIPGFDFNLVGLVRTMDYAGGIWEAADGTKTELPPVVRLMALTGMGTELVMLGYLSEGESLSVAGATIELKEIREYTILQYVHDPGVPLVYFGGLLLLLGLTYVLYFPYRTIRIILEARENKTDFAVGSNVSETPENIAKALENRE